MSGRTIGAICGLGSEMSSLVIGKAIKALADHKQVIIVQFPGGKPDGCDWSIMKRLEPELKIFRFEKANKCFDELSDYEKEETHLSILNSFNFTKKVIATGECDLLILDGILGLLEQQLVSTDDARRILCGQGEGELILTGKRIPDVLAGSFHYIERVDHVNVDNSRQRC